MRSQGLLATLQPYAEVLTLFGRKERERMNLWLGYDEKSRTAKDYKEVNSKQRQQLPEIPMQWFLVWLLSLNGLWAIKNAPKGGLKTSL